MALAALVCVTVIAVAVLTYSMAVLTRLADEHRRAEEAWTVERRELVNRVQAPDRLPMPLSEPFVWPADAPDEIGAVGTIAYPSDIDPSDTSA